jgi:crotonobetainyl-CoA:carnitine CoA-transferase CaiB-like acyl-CoA transferase
LLSALLKRRTTSEWESVLRAAGVPHAPVWDYGELFAHGQAHARQLRVTVRDSHGNPVDLIGSPFHIQGATLPDPRLPPRIGQDTDEVFREILGLTPARLDELRRHGVI